MEKYLDPHRGAFYSSVAGTLAVAFDEAWQSVRAGGGPYAIGENAEAARAALASHIIGAALLGERDPRRLCDGAIAAVGREMASAAAARSSRTPRQPELAKGQSCEVAASPQAG